MWGIIKLINTFSISFQCKKIHLFARDVLQIHCLLSQDLLSTVHNPFSCINTSIIHLQCQGLLLLLSLFSRVQLCDPIDGSPPGSSVPGILQARILEWVAISFSTVSRSGLFKVENLKILLKQSESLLQIFMIFFAHLLQVVLFFLIQ